MASTTSPLLGVAAAYAEGVPVLSISGALPQRAIGSKALPHHTLTDGDMRRRSKLVTQATPLIQAISGFSLLRR